MRGSCTEASFSSDWLSREKVLGPEVDHRDHPEYCSSDVSPLLSPSPRLKTGYRNMDDCAESLEYVDRATFERRVEYMLCLPCAFMDHTRYLTLDKKQRGKMFDFDLAPTVEIF